MVTWDDEEIEDLSRGPKFTWADYAGWVVVFAMIAFYAWASLCK